MTAQVELNMFAGAAFEHAVEWRSRTATGAVGDPVDLSGMGFRFVLSRAGEAVLEASTESGALVAPEPKAGVLYFCIGAEALTDLAPGDYEHSLTPLRDGEATTPLWVGRARVRVLGATSGPAMRIVGPPIPQARVLRQGAGSTLSAAPAAPGAAFAGSLLARRVAALEEAQPTAAEPVDLGPIVEELGQLRAQIEAVALSPAAGVFQPTGAIDDPRVGELMETAERLAAQVGALSRRPVVEPDALTLLSQRLAALEETRAVTNAGLTTGAIMRANRDIEIPDAFGAVLLAALRTAGPCLAIAIGDPSDPTTWDVHVAASATKGEVADIQAMIDEFARLERFALIDNAGFVMAVADRRAQRSVWPAEGLLSRPEEIVPLPLTAVVAIGARVRGAAIYPAGDIAEVVLGNKGAAAGADDLAEGGDEPG